MKLLWLSDIHLDCINSGHFDSFLNFVKSTALNQNELASIVISGDISNGDLISSHMELWKNELVTNNIGFYFVLGNHDYYNRKISDVRNEMKIKFSNHWLPAAGIIKLSEKTALIGHDGWTDGQYANWFQSSIDLNDYYQIYELSRQWWTNGRIFDTMNKLAQESAEHVYTLGTKALNEENYDFLFAVTHPPAFKENSVYQGKMSDDNWLPHFSSKHMGDSILRLADENPNKKICILQGHSHGYAKFEPRSNVLSLTAEAVYRHPRVTNIFDIL